MDKIKKLEALLDRVEKQIERLGDRRLEEAIDRLRATLEGAESGERAAVINSRGDEETGIDDEPLVEGPEDGLGGDAP